MTDLQALLLVVQALKRERTYFTLIPVAFAEEE